MKTSEILDKAADVIVDRGWWQGDFMPEEGDDGVAGVDLNPTSCPVCVLAAINVAAGTTPNCPLGSGINERAYGAAEALASSLGLADEPRLDITTVVGDGWNDDPKRTAEQVIAELRAAAASERSEGR